MKKLIGSTLLLAWAPFSTAALIDNGLEWLDLSATAGKSFNQVSAELGAGGLYDGYRYATQSEINTLFVSAGIPDIDAGLTVANVGPVTALISSWDADLWGTQPGVYEFGYFLTAGVQTGLLWLNGGSAEATTGPDRLSISNNPDYSVSYLGSALVRASNGTVPVPATLALMSIGLAGFGYRRRKPIEAV